MAEIQLSIVDDSRAHAEPGSQEQRGRDEDDDPALTQELGRRLEALERGEAGTVSRAEMKLRLARRRASSSSR